MNCVCLMFSWLDNVEKLPGCVTSQGSVITSPTANLKASDLVMNVGSFLFNTWLPAKAEREKINKNRRNLILRNEENLSKKFLLSFFCLKIVTKTFQFHVLYIGRMDGWIFRYSDIQICVFFIFNYKTLTFVSHKLSL